MTDVGTEEVEIVAPDGGRLDVSRKAYQLVYRPKGYKLAGAEAVESASVPEEPTIDSSLVSASEPAVASKQPRKRVKGKK